MAMVILHCHAQNNNKEQDEFESFRSNIHKDFESFRAEIMRNYIEFIKNPWKEFESVAPVPKPQKIPVPPVVLPKIDTIHINSNPITIEDIIPPIPVTPQPQPIEEIPENDTVKEKKLTFDFYGTSLSVRLFTDGNYTIGKISEKEVGRALSILSSDEYNNVIFDCLKIREEYKFCDWAYLQFVQSLSDHAFGKSSNESALMTAYILIQSGYKIRLAYSGEKLYVLYASKHCLFNRSSYFLDGDTYYGIEQLPSRMKVSDTCFPKEQNISLLITQQPLFHVELSSQREIKSKDFSAFKVKTSINKNLMAFYETYPSSYYEDNYMTQWAQYANTPMATEVVSTVYPVMNKILEGLSEKEKVSRLLNWVQTGLEYEFDDKVWGHDRTFFSEESLFYPYCDCEDRSILFTRLIRDLLGLECALLYYPGHLATAVHFSDEIKGDYINYGGKRYVVCDPTYIGASVGMSMPNLNSTKIGAIILNPTPPSKVLNKK